MKRQLLKFLWPLLAVSCFAQVRIGVVSDGPWLRVEDARPLFETQIRTITAGEFDVVFPDDAQREGDWTLDGVQRALDQLLADDDVDLILTLGAAASDMAARRPDLAKPVIAPFLFAVATDGEDPPPRNLHAIVSVIDAERAVSEFSRIAEFENLTVLVSPVVAGMVQELQQVIRANLSDQNVQVTIMATKDTAEATLAAMPANTDAVLTTDMLDWTPQVFDNLIRGLKQRNLPSFSDWGRIDVARGILASIVPSGNLDQLARASAVAVLDILRQERGEAERTYFRVGERLTINMETARAIDVFPGLHLLTEADLINEERTDITRTLTIDRVVREALENNLEILAADRGVLAGAESVLERRAALMPQLNFNTTGARIDSDRARISQGSNPETSLTATASGEVLLYSDRARAGYQIEQSLQQSRVEDREALKLDITQAATIAYLDVLRAKTFERIQKEFLYETRANLERALIRRNIGSAGPEEVFRWESQIATNRQEVLVAESNSMNAMIALNQVLNRPIDEQFLAQETELSDPLLTLVDKTFLDLVAHPRGFRDMRRIMVDKGLNISPELKELDAVIDAQERSLLAANRAFWAPDVALGAEVSQWLSTSGEGSDNRDLIGLNDTDWSVFIVASIPLYAGGERTAAKRRNTEELNQLNLQRDGVAQIIETRIQQAVNATRASYPSIRLLREGADAARKNLDLVEDSYEEGAVSIINVIDAQANSLAAEEQAANAVFDFLIDLMNLQRTVGEFFTFMDADRQKDWLGAAD